ncbi:hybrid sensor histidine kinase/response regulator [Desulfolithobacter sp.]
MMLSWWPVVISDIVGSLATLGLALASFKAARQWVGRRAEDIFRQYIYLLTVAIVFFAVSRSFGHLVKQFLLLGNMPGVWRSIAPVSGSVNSAVFVVIFAFGIYFHRFRTVHEELEHHKHHLEQLVEERTQDLEQINFKLEEEIAERRHIEIQLLESRATLENIFNSSVPTCITGLDYTIKHANEAYREVWPFMDGADQVKCHENRPGSTCHTKRCTLRLVVDGHQERVTCELEKECRGKGVRYYLVTARPFYDAGGELIGIIQNFQDITARKMAERALSAERERLAITLKSIGDGVICTGTDGRVTLLNAMAENLTGWSSSEAIGQPLKEIFQLVNDRTGMPCENPVEKVLATGNIVGLGNHGLLVGRDGKKRHIADSGAPIRDHDGAIIGVVLVFRDVTRQLQMEKELQKVQKLESIGVLAGGIAHDFNNLLAAIIGSLSLCERLAAADSKIMELVCNAKTASLRAKELTGQLLTFAKGGVPVKKTSSLGGVIRESVDFVLHGEKVSCLFQIPDDLWLVDIDPGQISQVLQNLVLNARDAMPDGGTVTISCANLQSITGENIPGLDNGPYVRITVSDTGCGIDQDRLERIFEPYYTTRETGSGLGLAICHSIIKRHNGHIAVESCKGAGSSFKIYLPADPDARMATTESGDEGRMVSGGGRVLVMDDEELVRAVTKSMLEGLGYSTVTVNDGREAVQAFRRYQEDGTPFDMVIMDLTVPGGMGGREAAEEILALDPRATLIVSSGYSNDPVMADCHRYGFAAALVKPFLLKDLEQVLAELS